MINSIQLIPLVELPTLKDEQSMIHPAGTSLTNTSEWNEFQKRELAKNYNNIISPVVSGVYQYRLLELSDNNLKELINLHISEFTIEECCSLFGGYGLEINGEIVLFPQCCGLLEEIKDWKKILSDDFEPFYFMECHPSPKFMKDGESIVIECLDEGESFFPPTQKRIIVNHELLKQAIKVAIDELTSLSNKINNIFQNELYSKKLIWGGY